MRLNLLEIGLFAVCMGMMISCNSKEEKVEYPQIIIDNKLESYYERAKWDLYKMNSSGMGRVDYMLYLDSLLNAELNIRDTLTGVNYLNRKLAKNEAEMKKRFPNHFHYYVECDLELFEFERFPIVKGDTITLTFFPHFGNQKLLYKLTGGNIHTIEYVKGKASSYKSDDLGGGWISEEELLQMETEFKDYLSKKKDVELSSWLTKAMKLRNY